MARPAYSLAIASRIKTINLTLFGMGPLVAWAARTMHFTMPERGTIVGMTLDVGASGGTHVTSAVDVHDDGSTVLDSTFDVDGITPSTPIKKEGSDLADAAADIAKDSEMSVVLTESGGTNPTVAAVNLQIDYVPLGD